MTRVPRASFCITILDDEDYRVLMTSRGGVEAFGVFVSMVLVGRERLQQGKARQMSDSAALRFDNSTAHVIEMAHVTTKQMDNCLSMLAVAAKETGGEPWMHIDETRHLVIRSFFKFNTQSSWGGARQGAGRPSTRNQDGSELNQDEFNLKPTRNVSGSSSGSGTGPLPPPPAADVEIPAGSHQECVELAMELFDDRVAQAISRNRVKIDEEIGGEWACYASAMKHTHARLQAPNAEPIKSILPYLLSIAREYVLDGGPPPDPVSVAPKPSRANGSANHPALWTVPADDPRRLKAIEDARRRAAEDAESES